MLGFKSFETAEETIAGIEVMHMIRKGQVECKHSTALSDVKMIDELFG
jgi:transposase, IS6 family